MQEQSPARVSKKTSTPRKTGKVQVNSQGKPPAEAKPGKYKPRSKGGTPPVMKSMAMNNPYQNVPVQSRAPFNFPGAVL